MILLFIIIALLGFGFPQLQIDQTNGPKIVFFGDSITELGVKPRGYVTLIRNHFKTEGSDVQIVGAGVSGNRVPDLLRRVDRDVLAIKPFIVIVYIGINDVWHFSMKNLHGTPKEEFRKGLIELVKRIRDGGAQVVLCTPSVIGEKKNGENPQDAMLDEYSEIIRSVAEEQEVALCDLRQAFIQFESLYNSENIDRGLLTYDGVHLSDDGNRLVAEEFIKLLETQ
jgi:lysophospholipase L1-like esterase